MYKKLLCAFLLMTVSMSMLPMERWGWRFPIQTPAQAVTGLHDRKQQAHDVVERIKNGCDWFSRAVGVGVGYVCTKKAFPFFQRIFSRGLSEDQKILHSKEIKVISGIYSALFAGCLPAAATYLFGKATNAFGLVPLCKRLHRGYHDLKRHIRENENNLYEVRNDLRTRADEEDLRGQVRERAQERDAARADRDRLRAAPPLPAMPGYPEMELRHLRLERDAARAERDREPIRMPWAPAPVPAEDPAVRHRLEEDLRQAQNLRDEYRGAAEIADRERDEARAGRVGVVRDLERANAERDRLRQELEQANRRLAIVNAPNHPSRLVRAIAANNVDEVRRLCNGQLFLPSGDRLINEQDEYRLFPIFYASRKTNQEIIHILAENGARIINASDDLREALRDNQDILQLFLKLQWQEDCEQVGTYDCPLCYENVVDGLAMFPCGHIYCGNCLNLEEPARGQLRQCPQCNQGVVRAQQEG